MNLAVTYLLVILSAVVLTCVIELPIIRAFKITRNNIFIIAVNVATNLILNIVYLILGICFRNSGTIWLVFSEALFIPVGEAELYNLISDSGRKRIYIGAYTANAVSFLAGLFITKILGL